MTQVRTTGVAHNTLSAINAHAIVVFSAFWLFLADDYSYLNCFRGRPKIAPACPRGDFFFKKAGAIMGRDLGGVGGLWGMFAVACCTTKRIS